MVVKCPFEGSPIYNTVAFLFTLIDTQKCVESPTRAMHHIPLSAYTNYSGPAAQRHTPSPSPNLYHSFEDPMNTQQLLSQPAANYHPTQPEQPPQGYPQPTHMFSPSPNYADPATPVYASPIGPQQGYMPPQQAPQYGSYPQPPSQQYEQQQHQGYPAAAPNLYPPAPQTQPQIPLQHQTDATARSELIRVRMLERVSANRSQPFDNPTIPRLMPETIREDQSFRCPAPPYINPVHPISVRPTMYTLPATTQLADSLQLPLGITVSPFAEENVPVVDFSQLGNRVVRCRRCGAYINPFTTFSERGNRWQCILCRGMTECSKEYASPLSNGLRPDLMNRPELCHASVDILASPEFLRMPPRCPIQILMLDCSPAAVTSGLLAAVCSGALHALEGMKDDEVMRMGIVGYDTTVYFFNVSPALSTPRMVASPDSVNDVVNINDACKLEAVELPCAISDLVVPIKDSYHHLRRVLEALPEFFADSTEVGCAFGPALAAAISLLTSNGGKILTTIASMPSIGEGKLKKRFDVAKMSRQPKEYTMLTPAGDWYKQRALACSTAAVSVDIITGNGAEEIDLATIAPLARYTCGNIFRVTPLNLSGVPLQVSHMLTRFMAFDAVLRIRTSTGIIIPNFYGHCHVREPDLLSLPVGHQDSSFSVELSIGPKFGGNFGYVQFAVMYTSRERERRIRLHTIQLRLSPNLAQVINSVNSIGTACFLTKMCIDSVMSMPFAKAREAIVTRVTAALKSARRQAALQGTQPNAGQFLIAESMMYIPQILNGFFRDRSTVEAGSAPISPDARIQAIAAVMASPPEAMLAGYLSWTFQLYSPHTPIEVGPAAVYSSSVYMSSQSILVTVTREAFVLWYGKRANPKVLQAFRLSPVEANDLTASNEPNLSQEQLDDLQRRTEELLQSLKVITRPAFCSALLPCPQTKAPEVESMLARCLVEDDQGNLLSYKTFLDTMMQRSSTN